METPDPLVGVVLMSFGSPEGPEGVGAYLASVRAGREVPEELVVEFQRRYRLVGGSPLLHITSQQASALEQTLNAAKTEDVKYRVTTGMLHSVPKISEALAQLMGEGIEQVIAIVLSPQYSPIIMGGYQRAVEEACGALGAHATVRVAGPWHELPSFLEALACRVRQALDRFSPVERHEIPVIFTAHSLPKSVADQEPDYIEQLSHTAATVAQRVGLEPRRWQFAYQSAGHTPQEWLKPDIKELFPELREAGHRAVLVVPVQFLADHLEVLYDLDIEARTEAEHAGLAFHRPESFNVMPVFIQALADVVRREIFT